METMNTFICEGYTVRQTGPVTAVPGGYGMPVEMVNPPTWVYDTRWNVAVNCKGIPLVGTCRKYTTTTINRRPAGDMGDDFHSIAKQVARGQARGQEQSSEWLG